MVVVLKPNGQSTMLFCTRLFIRNPSRQSWNDQKQLQDDEKVRTSSSVNTRSYRTLINFKGESCFLCNNPAASGSESLHNASIYIINAQVCNNVVVLNEKALLAKLKHSNMIAL